MKLRVMEVVDFIGAKDDGGGGDNSIYKTCKASGQIVTTNKPTPSFFYRPDVLPVANPEKQDLLHKNQDIWKEGSQETDIHF